MKQASLYLVSKQTFNAITLVLLFCNIHEVLSMGRVVSDWRIQNKEVTPVLGRGYSVATGNLQSSCLNVEEQTTPSYDYDYFFTEIANNEETSINKAFSGKISSSFGFLWAKSKVDSTLENNKDSKQKKHFIIATMRTQRYYSSVDEVHSELSADAKTLLESGQFMSFFQACGPNYIRSVRRAAEITAIFEYESTEGTSNSDFESSLKMDIQGLVGSRDSSNLEKSASMKVMSSALKSSLTISVRAFGLGLNNDGASSLQARSMDDFKNVMDFAFQSMQQRGVGMVQGIEIVAWVDNPQFQVAAGLATTLQDCENGVCSTVSMELKKMNLSSNAEYVSTMNRVMRTHIDGLYNIQSCRSMLNGYSSDQKDEPLMNQRKFRDLIDDKGNEKTSGMTVGELKVILDVNAVKKWEEKIKNYSTYFYSPCMDALTQSIGGQKGGSSMVTPWYSLDACKDSTCTVSGAIVNNRGECTLGEADKVAIEMEQYCMPTLIVDI